MVDIGLDHEAGVMLVVHSGWDRSHRCLKHSPFFLPPPHDDDGSGVGGKGRGPSRAACPSFVKSVQLRKASDSGEECPSFEVVDAICARGFVYAASYYSLLSQ